MIVDKSHLFLCWSSKGGHFFYHLLCMVYMSHLLHFRVFKLPQCRILTVYFNTEKLVTCIYIGYHWLIKKQAMISLQRMSHERFFRDYISLNALMFLTTFWNSKTNLASDIKRKTSTSLNCYHTKKKKKKKKKNRKTWWQFWRIFTPIKNEYSATKKSPKLATRKF